MHRSSRPARKLVHFLHPASPYIYTALCLVGCGPQQSRQTPVLEWKDPEAGATFRVTDRPGAIATNYTTLYVERDGGEVEKQIDDEAVFSTIAFVRYQHWLLVVCKGVDEVWAGYDYDNGHLYGEHEWDRLPFAKWTGQGKVVVERELGKEAYRPAGFPKSGPD